MKYLLILLTILRDALSIWKQQKQDQKDQQIAQEKVEQNVEKAEAAVRVPDDARTERLRARFDRSRTSS